MGRFASRGRAGPITFPLPPPLRLVPAAAGNTRPHGRAPVRAGSSRCLAGGAADVPGIGFDGIATVCVFAWEDRAHESCLANREKLERYLARHF